MLDAACPGEVFTSPTPDQMLAATQAVDGGAGALHIVKNYTGDVMNFEMAADLARDEGLTVEQVVIDDDVAVKDSLYTAGRRGVGATVLAEKICGAAAEAGRPLAEVAGLCRTVNERSRSMGVALTSCTTPMAGKPTFDLGDDEMEVGVGIHGEPGRERRPLARRARSSRRSPAPSSRICRSRAATGCSPSSTAWAARRSWSCTSSTTSCTGSSAERGIDDRAQPRRLLHDRAGHGRLLDHAAAARRRAGRGCGTHRSTRPACGGARERRVPAPSTRRASPPGCARFAAEVAARRDELTDLDAAIGDADHGVNMDRGMQAVAAKLPADADGPAGDSPARAAAQDAPA